MHGPSLPWAGSGLVVISTGDSAMVGSLKAAVAFGLIAMLADQAVGQGQAVSGPGLWIGFVQTALLVDPAVHKDLKLDEGQVEKAKALAAEIREKFDAARPKVRGLPGDQAQAKMAELVPPILDDAMKSARSFLKPEQIKRFHQIDIQAFGPTAFTYPSVTNKLVLTEEQGPKIRAVIVELQGEQRKAMQEAGNDRQAARPKVMALRKETLPKIVSLLTDDQKKVWKELIGEPFDEASLQPPPAR
jgi:hypothetical protein